MVTGVDVEPGGAGGTVTEHLVELGHSVGALSVPNEAVIRPSLLMKLAPCTVMT